MAVVVVKTQSEFDALPAKFDVCTTIEIYSGETWVSVGSKRENSHVEAWGNSHVVAWGNSHVVARGNSHVEARGNSHVEAWGNSHVVARGNSHVEARENSHVVAWGNSHVEAWGNSHVEARENSHVEAWGNSHVEARENSHVEARENSYVEAWGNSQITGLEYATLVVFSASVAIKKLRQFAICRLMPAAHKVKPEAKDETVTIAKSGEVKHTKKTFLDAFSLEPDSDGRIVLFKVVNPENGCDYQTGTIKYEGRVTCPDWNPDPKLQCGGGLHLSARKGDALAYHEGKILECKVHVDDFVVFATDISKVRCREVEVIGEAK